MDKFAVVGAGIAGLSVAYGLIKSGKEVHVFFDPDQKEYASTQQHGWFHTGNLYLLNEDYSIYRHFQQNLNYVDLLRSDFQANESFSNWFGECINFHFKSYESKVFRILAPHGRKVRRAILRFEGKNYSGLQADLAYKRHLFGQSIFGKDHFVLAGSDVQMNTVTIMRDLVAYLSKNGATFHEQKVDLVKDAGTNVLVNDMRFDHCFLCCGRGLVDLVTVKMNTYYSLIGIYDQKMSPENFVKIHPNPTVTINSINHKINNHEFSVCGDGVNFKVRPDLSEIKTFTQKFEQHFGRSFDHLYVGVKSELVSSGEDRNYLPSMNALGHRMTGVTMGKFSNFPYIIKRIITSFAEVPCEGQSSLASPAIWDTNWSRYIDTKF